MRKTYYVYILASRPHGAIYIGSSQMILTAALGEHRDEYSLRTAHTNI